MSLSGSQDNLTVDIHASTVEYPKNGAVKSGGARLLPTQSQQAATATRYAALMKVFNNDDRVLIVISADPDAVASAVALKRILWRKVAQIVVTSTNQVKRPDNVRLIQSLNLKLPLLDTIDTSAFTKLVVVDSQPNHNPLTGNLVFNAVIDHHPIGPLLQNPPPSFVDIRPDIGATATMMVNYLKAAKIKPNPRLSTALFYAIKTDTQNFVRQGQIEDMRAFRWLYPYVHAPLLSEIEQTPIMRSSFKNILKGLNQAVFDKNATYTFLDKADHADTLVILADFLLQISGVNRAIAAGICGDKLVVIFRAGGLRQNVGKLAAKAFGEYGSAGGHKNMARAEIILQTLDSKIKNSPAAISRFICRRLADSSTT